MAQLTEEQVQNSYVARMGEELGRLFHALEHDLTWMHWRWKQLKILFGDKPSRAELLNQSAPFFFYLVQRVFFEDTLLGIARLVSGEKSAGHEVLTIRRLEKLVNDQIRPEVSTLIGRAKDAAKFALDYRNNLIAHRNLALSLHKNNQTLPEATREQVEAALGALRDVLNCVEGHYCNAHSIYDSPALHDARELLYVLRDGIARRKERHAAWNRGENVPAPEGDI
jgi:AbiU2